MQSSIQNILLRSKWQVELCYSSLNPENVRILDANHLALEKADSKALVDTPFGISMYLDPPSTSIGTCTYF